MYLWNTCALVDDFKRGPLPEIEQLKYFLFASVLAAADAAMPSDPTEPSALPTWAAVVTAVSFVILGTVWCFRTNASGDNKDFVVRFLALHVPIGFRLIALMFVAGVPLMAIFGPAFLLDLIVKGGAIIEVAFGALVALVFYWRVNVRIREISHVG